ncbi:MAG: metallophosphoesterase family protein [Candidatus Woesearchaeota archaeon]
MPAIIADIHSNLEALETVMDDIKERGIHRVFCCGDIVGYGADPNSCVDIIKNKSLPSVAGNHDINSAKPSDLSWFNPHARKALEWTGRNLKKRNRDFLAGLPQTMVKDGMFMVHGSPADPLHEYVFPDDAGLIEKYAGGIGRPVLVMAHTHIPFVKRLNSSLVVNPGSVGQPRDSDPRASYCVVWEKRGSGRTPAHDAEIVRVDYDIDRAAEKIRREGLPDFLAERLYKGV